MILHHTVFEAFGDEAKPLVGMFKDDFKKNAESFIAWFVGYVPLNQDAPGEEVYGAPIGAYEADTYFRGCITRSYSVMKSQTYS